MTETSPRPSATVRFVVPWRPDGEARNDLWAFTRARWERSFPEIDLVTSPGPDGPFNRSAAINDAARGEWDLAVVLDADVLAEPEQVEDALERAGATGRLTLGFERFVGLTPNMSKLLMKGYVGDWNRGARFRSEFHESSIVVVPRPLWDGIGGFDERFVGWGQEDVAFVQAARVLGGQIERVGGDVFHLWHARSPDRDPRLGQYRANQALGARYRETHEPNVMRALLSERTR